MDNVKILIGSSFTPVDKPKKIVILLHGYGDNAENFISIANDLYDPAIQINFFAPNAPSIIPQYPLGRQWFNLYPNGINFNDAGEVERKIMKKDCDNSLNLINKYIKNLCDKYKLTLKDCFVVGFSQGAMMAYEFGKYIDKKLGGIAIISGRILPSNDHTNKFFLKTPILIIHGKLDDIIKPIYFKEACDILESYGYFYEKYLIKDLDHSISFQTIELIKNFIKKNI